MRTPRFWQHQRFPAQALLPVAALYSRIQDALRARVKPVTVSVPVICVGNVVAGGAGKTPVALAIAALLFAQRKEVHFLSRGYLGKLAGPVRVDTAIHTAYDVGDEPLLLAKQAPTWVAKDRVLGAQAAVNAGAEVIIMDDGFQNPSLHKHRSLLVIDGRYGFGNHYRIPAGPLRESIASAMLRASALILIGEDVHALRTQLPLHIPVISAKLIPTKEAYALKDSPVVAFAGIAHPDKFYDTLTMIGCDIRAKHDFADHHFFSVNEIEVLRRQAKALGARLVTTTKDYARLPSQWRHDIFFVPVEISFDDPQAISTILS